MRAETRAQAGSTYVKMVCSYILVFLLPVVVAAALIYHIFMEPVNDQAMQLTIDDARMAQEACERQVQSAIGYYGVFLSNDRLADSFLPSDFEEVRLLKIQLKTIAVSSNGLDAFLYCAGDQFLYSSASSVSVRRFLTYYPVEGMENEAAFQERLGSVKEAGTQVFRVGGTKQGLMLLLHEAGNAKYLFYYMPQSLVETLFSSALTGNRGLAMIHSENGSEPLAYVLNDAERSLESYLGALVGSGLSEASGDYTCRVQVEGKDCILVSMRSESLGLRYTTVLFGDMERRLRSVTLGFWLMMLITLLFGVTLALLISRRNYQPIRRLRTKASELVAGGANDKDDYGNIYHAMEDLGNQNRLMRASVSDMQAYLTHKLFKGDMKNVEESNQLQHFFGISAYAAIYRVCVVCYEQPVSMHEMNRQVRSLLPEGVQMIAQQLEGDRYAVILTGPNPSREAIGGVLKALAEARGVRCVAAGHLQYELQRIPISYVEAMVTSEIMLSGGITGLLMYASISLAQPCSLMVEKVERALDEGDWAGVQCLLYELKQRLPGTSVQELRVLSNNLIQLLKRCCEEKGRRQLALDETESYLILQYAAPEEFAPLLDTLCERFQRVMSADGQEMGDSRRIDEIHQYLLQHYNDAELSLQQVADDYGMSMATFSEQFRRKAGMLPSDYIAKLRMDQSKRLLIRTNLSVADIGMEVGFLNANSFIRRFRQLVGMTPGEYRKHMQEKE